MQFHEYQTMFQAVRHLLDRRETAVEFYQGLFVNTARHCTDEHDRKMTQMQALAESGWIEKRRPFYAVWPRVLPMLLKLDLGQVTGNMIPRMPTLVSIRLPVDGNTLTQDGVTVRSILASDLSVFAASQDALQLNIDELPTGIHENLAGNRGVFFWVDVGETMKGPAGYTYPLMTYRFFPIFSERKVAESIVVPTKDSYTKGLHVPVSLIDSCIQLYCTLALLQGSDEVLERAVLSKDLDKFRQTGDEKFVSKAERNGVVGWHVGRGIEVSPHFRRPHFGWRWTGEGRKIPKFVPIKGAIVHRDMIEKLPTGEQGSLQED